MIIKVLKEKLNKDSFAVNLLITSLGSSIAYIIGLLFTPFISRIYGPEAYGAFSVFNSLVINISLIVSLGYEQAVIIPERREDFYGLIKLNFILIISFSILISLVLLTIPRPLLEYLNLTLLEEWLLFLPILIALNVLSQVFTTIGVKYKKYINSSGSRVASVIGSKAYALSHGILHLPNVGGFILGELIGKSIFIYGLFRNHTIRMAFLFSIKKIKNKIVKQVAIRYKKYPLYNLPGVWIITLTMQLPIYSLLYYFGTESVGYYSMASMLLFVPLNLFGRSMGTVFIQKASILFNENNLKELKRISLKMTKSMALFSIVPIAIILTFGESIFILLLGSEWQASGLMAKYLCLYLFSELIAFPLGTLFRVLRIEKTYFIYSILSFFITFSLILIGARYNSMYTFVLFIAIARFLDNGLKSFLILKNLEHLQH
jgi:O-antigen/teichoic acid export membrane protein